MSTTDDDSGTGAPFPVTVRNVALNVLTVVAPTASLTKTFIAPSSSGSGSRRPHGDLHVGRRRQPRKRAVSTLTVRSLRRQLLGSGVCAVSTVTTTTGDDNRSVPSSSDPGAGSVTGGGVINSPRALRRMVRWGTPFTVTSKYASGANVPAGYNQLMLQAAGTIEVDGPEWLVVNGACAQ
jgi:hypothetical protein